MWGTDNINCVFSTKENIFQLLFQQCFRNFILILNNPQLQVPMDKCQYFLKLGKALILFVINIISINSIIYFNNYTNELALHISIYFAFLSRLMFFV